MRTFFVLVTCVALVVQTLAAMQLQSPGSLTRNIVLIYFPVLAIAFSAGEEPTQGHVDESLRDSRRFEETLL